MKIAERLTNRIAQALRLIDDARELAAQEHSSRAHALAVNLYSTVDALRQELNGLIDTGMLDEVDAARHQPGTTVGPAVETLQRPPGRRIHASAQATGDQFLKRGALRMVPRRGRDLYPRG